MFKQVLRSPICGFMIATLSLPVWADPTSLSSSGIGSLKEAYFSAVKNSERIAISDQFIRQAENLYRQTWAGSLPSIAYRHEFFWQDRGDPLADRVRDEGMFRAETGQLSGYRELAAIRAGRAARRQEEHRFRFAEQLLLRDIAGAFYGYLQAEENVRSTEGLLDSAGKRRKELIERVRVGRSREAERVSQDFQITTLESQLEETKRSMASFQDFLSFLIAAPVAQPFSEEPEIKETGSLDSYLARVEKRPDLQAAIEQTKISRQLVRIARSDFFPFLDGTANYYTDRPESEKEVEWDASLDVGISLWSWGESRASLNAAHAGLTISELEARALHRQVELDVRNAHRDFVSAQEQIKIKKKAVELARRDYELQIRDDRRGLVTSLEVLESLNRLNAAELVFNNAKLVVRLAGLNLELASGQSPEEILQ